jgi:hypothetical protein
LTGPTEHTFEIAGEPLKLAVPPPWQVFVSLLKKIRAVPSGQGASALA